MTADSHVVTNNHILMALSESELERLEPLLELVDLPQGHVLYAPGDIIYHVYFPDHAMISVIAYTDDGEAAEASVIGCEGVIGVDVVLGANTTTNEHITQLAGIALRIKTPDIRAEFARRGELHDLMLAFTRKLMVQFSQTALCNRLHTAEKRLSRWLLMCRDRSESDVLPLTQEFISIMLGASRSTVTLTVIQLQNLGFISYSGGILTIVDRAGLEAYTCPCYATIQTAYGLGK